MATLHFMYQQQLKFTIKDLRVFLYLKQFLSFNKHLVCDILQPKCETIDTQLLPPVRIKITWTVRIKQYNLKLFIKEIHPCLIKKLKFMNEKSSKSGNSKYFRHASVWKIQNWNYYISSGNFSLEKYRIWDTLNISMCSLVS